MRPIIGTIPLEVVRVRRVAHAMRLGGPVGRCSLFLVAKTLGSLTKLGRVTRVRRDLARWSAAS